MRLIKLIISLVVISANVTKSFSQEIIPIPNDTVQTVFQVVETAPEFPGGTSGLIQFLSQNITYPASCWEKGIHGRVIVHFIVNKDGSIINPTIAVSVDPELDAEAIRIVKLMPKWKPGLMHGKPVRVRYTLPINFSLN